MSEPAKTASVHQLLRDAAKSASSRGSSAAKFGGGGGGRGGDGLDAETQRFVESKVETVKAQNDARFAEVLAKIDGMSEKVNHLEPVSIWKMASLSAATVVALVGILGVMADRFDGGVAASGLVTVFQEAQKNRDAAQDAKLDQIIDAVNKLKPATAP